MHTYRNPFSLELTIARIVGWGWFLGGFITLLAVMINNVPMSLSHIVWAIVLFLVGGSFIGSAETRAQKGHAEFEERMQRIIHQ